MGVVIPTLLLGVHVESAGDLWFSLHQPLPATFSPPLWQALIDMLSLVIGERKGRGGAISWGGKKKRQLTCSETILTLNLAMLLRL